MFRKAKKKLKALKVKVLSVQDGPFHISGYDCVHHFNVAAAKKMYVNNHIPCFDHIFFKSKNSKVCTV